VNFRMPITGKVSIHGIKYDGAIRRGDDLVDIVIREARKSKFKIRDRDIVILSHTAVSKALGLMVRLADVKPSAVAMSIAERLGRDAELVEVILREAEEIVRMEGGRLITLAKTGLVSANSQVDRSNVGSDEWVVIAPRNPDAIAKKIRKEFKSRGYNVAVVLTDTLGRPFRIGEVNFAMGCSGIKPINDLRGKRDLFGRVLRVKRIAIVDELAAASELVTGSSSEGVIGAIVRGYKYKRGNEGARSLRRPTERDLFI
jgi:coenzyme F420-0:L-glutamate ligase/coenzyme F420-1:gamma-L-glutamate ligase